MGSESPEFTVFSQGSQPRSFCKQSVRGRKRALEMSSPAGFPPDHYLASPSPEGKTSTHVPAWLPGLCLSPLPRPDVAAD